MQYHTLTSKDKSKLFRQAGKCKICKGKSGSGRLVTDHCHTTGIVRGILCEKCNSWLGVIEGKKATKARITYITKLERKTGIPAVNFMFYLDNFRRAYIVSLFEKSDKPKEENDDFKTAISISLED